MGGCPYCGQMHSPLYICDEMRAARAKEPVDKPMAKTVDTMAKMAKVDMAKEVVVAKKPMAKEQPTTSTYRYRDPEKRRAYQRELMRQRYATKT
jgi:hypothetical protein